MPSLCDPSEYLPSQQIPPRPSINFIPYDPVSIEIPMEAFYREYRVDSPGRIVKYRYVTTPSAVACRITVVSLSTIINWRSDISELAPPGALYNKTDGLYYEDEVIPSQGQTPPDDKPTFESFVRRVNSHAPTTVQQPPMSRDEVQSADKPTFESCVRRLKLHFSTAVQHPPMSHDETQSAPGFVAGHVQRTAEGPLSDEQLHTTPSGKREGYKAPEKGLSRCAPQSTGRSLNEEVIGHNWVKPGLGNRRAHGSTTTPPGLRRGRSAVGGERSK